MSALFDAYVLITLAVLAAMLVGGLLTAAATTAPIAVRVLTDEAAAKFLRAFWPRYYRLGSGGGAMLTLVLGALVPSSPLGTAYASLLAILAALLTAALWGAQLMIPAINAARDAGDDARFGRLHRATLALTATGLLAGLSFIGALGWVLPGQYMIWMH